MVEVIGGRAAVARVAVFMKQIYYRIPDRTHCPVRDGAAIRAQRALKGVLAGRTGIRASGEAGRGGFVRWRATSQTPNPVKTLRQESSIFFAARPTPVRRRSVDRTRSSAIVADDLGQRPAGDPLRSRPRPPSRLSRQGDDPRCRQAGKLIRERCRARRFPDDPRHRTAAIGDQHLLAGTHRSQIAAEVCLGLADTCDDHAATLTGQPAAVTSTDAHAGHRPRPGSPRR